MISGGDLFVGDSARWHPSTDLFGFVPFAKRLARSIVEIKSTEGIVLAVTGEWGSGKSTLLNFVKHELCNWQVAPYPAVIEFNPWWFTSKEDLAPQIIHALRSKVSTNFGGSIDGLRSPLGKYAKLIASTASHVGGATAGVAIEAVLTGLHRDPPDIPQLKQRISRSLAGANQKFVFIIDDIDRLAPKETAELIRAIKALGDFPNVIYVLSFDRKVVAEAVGLALSTNGEEYLEKIIQATFAVPLIDKLTRRKWLFKSLDQIFEVSGGGEFDSAYWSQVYFGGLDRLIKTPRDVARFVNVLSVTYPAVCGEVSAIDFFALEALRMFEHHAYVVVRENRDMFTGFAPSDADDVEREKRFHDAWMEGTNDSRAVADLLSSIFPRFDRVVKGGYFESGPANWRKHLRACSKDVFPIYFQLDVRAGVASRSLISKVLRAAANSVDEVSELLISASRELDESGAPLSRDLIDRLRDNDEEVPAESKVGLLVAIFRTGDELITADDDGHKEFADVPGIRRLSWLANRIISDIPLREKLAVVSSALEEDGSLALAVSTIDSARNIVFGKGGSSSELSAYGEFSPDDVEELLGLVRQKVAGLTKRSLDRISNFPFILNRLAEFGLINEVRRALVPILMDIEALPSVLQKLVYYSTIHSSADPIARKRAILDPRMLDRFVNSTWLDINVDECAHRSEVSGGQREAVETYLRARSRLRDGKELNDLFGDD